MFILKDQEPLKYVQGLKNVGNNVKQFCSTMVWMKFIKKVVEVLV